MGLRLCQSIKSYIIHIWYNTIFTRMNEIILVHIWEKHKEKKEKGIACKVFNCLIHSKVNLSNDKKLIDRNGGKIEYIVAR